MVAEANIVKIAALRDHYNTESVFFKEHITDRLLSRHPDIQIEAESYFNSNLTEQLEAWVRGALRGISKPILINTLANMLDIKEKVLRNMMNNIAEDQGPGAIKFEIQKTLYFPEFYRQIQKDKITEQYL